MPRHTTDINLVEQIYKDMLEQGGLKADELNQFINLEEILDHYAKNSPHEYAIAKRWLKRLSRKGKKGHGR